MMENISHSPRRASKFARLVRNLRASQSGLAMIEFAYSMPILMGLGMYGTETAFLATANMKLSQTALNLADNASRLGQADNNVATPTIRESGINQVFSGAKTQGQSIDLMNHGRAILTSLEVTAGGQQFIRWRRCKGMKNSATHYNDDINGDNVVDTTFTGMGPTGAKVQASTNSAVMFVEVEYDYQPLFGNMFHPTTTVLRQEASFNIRDNRNLSAGLYNDLTPTTKAATCNKYDTVTS